VNLSLNIHLSRLVGGWLILLLAIFSGTTLQAGGIRDVAPTAADAPVMLETGRVGFNNFADFGVEEEGPFYRNQPERQRK